MAKAFRSGAASATFWRVGGALAAGAAVAATFSIGARDLLALDASADERYMAVPLARDMYQRAWRYHISSGCRLTLTPNFHMWQA